jgi:hypothetical protein
VQQLQRRPEDDSYEAERTSEYLRRIRRRQDDNGELNWRMIFIGFVSIAALGVDLHMLSDNLVRGIPATLFFSALLAIGVGGITSLFGGASHVLSCGLQSCVQVLHGLVLVPTQLRVRHAPNAAVTLFQIGDGLRGSA